MRRYVVHRAAQMLFVVFGVVTVTFFAVRLVPGDPARIMEPPGTPESVLKHDPRAARHGQADPRAVRRLSAATWCGATLATSFRGGRPVTGRRPRRAAEHVCLGLVSMVVDDAVSVRARHRAPRCARTASSTG